MEHTFREQIVAFAGIWQAVKLVQQVARRGQCDSGEFAVSINSLFDMSPKTTEAVYGSAAGVQTGLQLLLDQFGNTSDRRDIELTQYVVTLLHLERKLAKQPQMLQTLARELESAKGQAEHFSTTHENVIARLADIYAKTISTIPPKVIVQGEQGYLSNTANANKVRALLLAAIRSAVLWHQCGGRRLTLPFKRNKILQQAKALLTEINQASATQE